MAKVKYTGVGNRLVQHERLGEDELSFKEGEVTEITDAQADALDELCPGQFERVTDAPAASEEQGTEAPELPLSEVAVDEGDSGKGKTRRSRDA